MVSAVEKSFEFVLAAQMFLMSIMVGCMGVQVLRVSIRSPIYLYFQFNCQFQFIFTENTYTHSIQASIRTYNIKQTLYM